MLIIENNDKAQDPYVSPYGNHMVVLTREQIQALIDGKCIADEEYGEYGLFISMEV